MLSENLALRIVERSGVKDRGEGQGALREQARGKRAGGTRTGSDHGRRRKPAGSAPDGRPVVEIDRLPEGRWIDLQVPACTKDGAGSPRK